MDGWKMSDRGPSLLFVFWIREWTAENREINGADRGKRGEGYGGGENSGKRGGDFNEIDADGGE